MASWVSPKGYWGQGIHFCPQIFAGPLHSGDRTLVHFFSLKTTDNFGKSSSFLIDLGFGGWSQESRIRSHSWNKALTLTTPRGAGLALSFSGLRKWFLVLHVEGLPRGLPLNFFGQLRRGVILGQKWNFCQWLNIFYPIPSSSLLRGLLF